MSYRFLLLIFCIFLNTCTAVNVRKENSILINKKPFINKGFALIYSDSLLQKKIITKKIDDRSLIIFQKNLKINTSVRIKNMLNNKSIVAKVGPNVKYPLFYNTVISRRISEDLEIDLNEPYIEILEIVKDSFFIAKIAKTFDQEKNVANKAPVDTVNINDLNQKSEEERKTKKIKFSYVIKIADFYYINSAKSMKDRIKNETKTNHVKIKKLSTTKFRVFLGPFNTINSLQKAFNDINILEFENVEIIKND